MLHDIHENNSAEYSHYNIDNDKIFHKTLFKI